MPKKMNRKMGKKEKKKAPPKKSKSDPKPTTDQVIGALRCVIDPHTNINVYDMGLISELKVKGDNAYMVFRPTSPFCPLAFDLARSMKGEIWELEGIDDVTVLVVGHYQEDNINKALKGLRIASKKRKKARSRNT